MSKIVSLSAGVGRRPHVHVALSDRGWIIEECARQLSERLPYVSVGSEPDPAAAIQYYMTYSARRGRVSPVELALFTHREDEPNAARLFNQTASDVDHAVAMSRATEELIKGLGVERRSCISPGVDLDQFRPRLKIGVVGRTYHTGRKGEALVRAVMDVPDIDWHFTGDGWPEPGLHLSQDNLTEFYRSMDYILVSATNEGGPMSVLEALASGIPVIASDVGWANDYPHIPFERGNAASLRAVLEQLRAERFALRDHVAHMTWQNWAEAHDRLFATMTPEGAGSPPLSTPRKDIRSVALLTHGAEDFTLGGPSVRVPRTGEELARLGLRVTANNRVVAAIAEFDVVHGFNIWSPVDAYRMARQAERLGRPLVFSPILLDLREGAFWQADLLRAFRVAIDPKDAEARIDDAFAAFRHRAAARVDFEPGYTAALKAINEIASAIIFLSDLERKLFEQLVGAPATNAFLVRNPVDTARFDAADPDLFRTTYGLGDYVLCVGRLEHRKNQLMLAAALASTGIPLVLIGHEPEPEYVDLVRRFGGANLHIMGRIDPGSPLLASAIAGARVFALPSWAEGAPLAALEAAAAGVPMVLSDRSSEREYFGEHADYCDPASMSSIRDKIVKAWGTPRDEDARHALRQLVREHNDWSTHAQSTRAVYEAAVASANVARKAPGCLPAPVATSASTGIIFDITTWANNPDLLSGIVRVECAIARALLARGDLPARFVLSVGFGNFVEVPREIVERGSIGSFVKLLRSSSSQSSFVSDLADFSDLITVGSSWMQNATYAASMVGFARKHGLRLNVLMHDLTPHLFPHWYAEGYADIWNANCRTVVSHADRILVYSESTARDVGRFCQTQELETPALAKIRLADEIGDFAAGEMAAIDNGVRDWLSHRPFVLAVGALHARKNYGLLYDVWTILRERMGDATPHLVIVGGLAWNGRDVARAIREDGRVNTHIRILEDVDDGMLGWLYERSLFTVYPSLYEGWGLPVGESLARGKICLASAISSMPEIAPAVTDLLPPMDRSSWAARIEHYARSASSREVREAEIRAGFTVTSWARTTDDIVRALVSPTRVPVPDHYLAGAIATLGSSSAARFLEEGWYPVEPWGAWSGTERATIAFQLAGRPAGDMVLTIVGRVLKRPDDRCVYRVSVNGVACGSIVFDADLSPNEIEQSVGRVRVPGQVLDNGGYTRIVLETGTLSRVCDLNPESIDVRHLGLGLSAFILEAEQNAGDVTRFLSTRPEIREMLGIPVERDLARMLADHSGRPSITPGTWLTGLNGFVRSGTVLQEGAASEGGLLALVTGTARLRLASDAVVDLLVEIDRAAAIDIFANDDLIASCSLDGGAKLVTVCVPRTILGLSDPLRLVLAAQESRNAPEITVKRLRIRQEQALAPMKLSPGDMIDLKERLPEIAYKTADMMDLTVPFILSGVDADTVLEIGGISRRIASVEFDGEPATFVVGETGYALIAVGADQRRPRHGKIRFSAEVLDTGVVDGSANCQIALRRLAAMDVPSTDGAPLVIPFGAWHEEEEDGRQWGAGDAVSFWVRPGKASGIVVVAEHIGGLEAAAHLVVAVDGVATDVEIVPKSEGGKFSICIPLGTSDSVLRYVTVSGLPVARPVDLGINVDARMLSLQMLDVSALSTNET